MNTEDALKYTGFVGTLILLFAVIIEGVNKISSRLNPIQAFEATIIGIMILTIGVIVMANIGRKYIF